MNTINKEKITWIAILSTFTVWVTVITLVSYTFIIDDVVLHIASFIVLIGLALGVMRDDLMTVVIGIIAGIVVACLSMPIMFWYPVVLAVVMVSFLILCFWKC